MSDESKPKGERSRQAIMDAAFRLFIDQGYAATSMRQVADEAGLALGGIYNHFGSKEDIFKAIILDRHPYKQILPLILAAEGETADEFFRNAAQALVGELGKHPDLIKLLFIELVEFNGKHAPSIVADILPKLLPHFEKLVKIRKNLRPIHPAILMRSFLGMFFSYYMTELFLGNAAKKFMPKDSLEQFVDIYLNGILKEPA